MRTINDLHDYQKKAVEFQSMRPHSAMWLDPGLGKTAITLTSIAYLLSSMQLKAVVIVAPIRVCRLVWRQEAVKWGHTKHLRFSLVTGTRDQRTRALLRPADVYLVNYECLGWLAETLHTYWLSKGKELPFDGLVWDELSKMRNSATERVKSVKKILPHFKWRTGLTGTPASNGYKDLHGQFLVLDEGVRLGTSKTAFRTRFYRKEGQYREVAYDDTEDTIKKLIGDITLEMSAEDYNKLPDMIVNNVEVEMPEDIRKQYDRMEREFFLRLDSGTEIEVFNQGSLTNKCISEGTKVLTDQGWVKIEDYSGQLVWDGREWVNTSGLVCHGYKSVVRCWGVWMTPDHKVLTSNGWRTAQGVLNEQPGKGFDRSSFRLPYGDSKEWEQSNPRNFSKGSLAGEVCMRERSDHAKSESPQHSQTTNEVVRLSSWREGDSREGLSRNDQDPSVDDLAKHEVEVYNSCRQGLAKLWRKGDNRMSRMGVLREVLGRYGSWLSGSLDTGAPGRKRKLLQRELPVGEPETSGEQHKTEHTHRHSDRKDNDCYGGKAVQDKEHHFIQSIPQGVERGEVVVSCKVYDIINAGPRTRFTVMGENGEIFIVHNCLQFSNGAIYPVAGMPMWEPIHDLKLEALDEIIEESNGQPILCWYQYRSDAERIMKRFAALDPINLTECKSEKALEGAMARWKSGNCQLMISHFLSAGHGVDGLQHQGHTLVWFGITWSLDGYDQANARIRRQGQGVPVICHRILCKDTLDYAQAAALDEKATTQQGLRKAIKEYRMSKENS